MQAYGEGFAQVYDQQWTAFVRQVAPALLACYRQSAPGQAGLPVLDLCCGTGQLAQAFLERGYRVTGLDLSSAMLAHASRNNAAHVLSGQARFVQGDAADFHLDERFGLVTATYDALNHLDGLEALRRCFGCVYAALVDDGLFLFDLNTRVGLGRWCGTRMEVQEAVTLFQRGYWDADATRAWMEITGFVRRPDGLYERFDERLFNTAYALAEVEQELRASGFAAYPARLDDLGTPLVSAEAEGRVCFVARKRLDGA